MNAKQLQELGLPTECVPSALGLIHQLAHNSEAMAGLRTQFQQLIESPETLANDPVWGPLANEVSVALSVPELRAIDYRTWGTEIQLEAHDQMRKACHVPMAHGAALMPDAHVGYGLPIGGVLATKNAVIPYAVGVDIACRMKLSVFDVEPELLRKRPEKFEQALLTGTQFGVGAKFPRRETHDVMDRDWSITRVTRENKDRAWSQLGSSGSGNHFVEFGKLTVTESDPGFPLEPGTYVALLSHSGSRGAGAAVCSTYSRIAQDQLPERYKSFGRLAWLDLASEAGQEYWQAMNLMGEYAAANHEVIHRRVSDLLGAEIMAGVENHHNFAWLEEHGGEQVVVHRKGATPAGPGVLGVIPGSMADPAFVVRGLGQPESLNSASHGAGRQMSRTQANAKFRWKEVQRNLAKQGVTVLSAGADEVPFAYKDIRKVMAAQADLVTPLAQFDPKIVRMCGDGSRAED